MCGCVCEKEDVMYVSVNIIVIVLTFLIYCVI